MNIILQPFQTIPAASKITGLSEYKLRRGCKDGTIPNTQSGGIFYVDLPSLWDQMDEERQGVSEDQFNTKEQA